MIFFFFSFLLCLVVCSEFLLLFFLIILESSVTLYGNALYQDKAVVEKFTSSLHPIL